MDSCTLEILKKMKHKKGSSRVDAFTEGKLKLVNDVLLYYSFLYQDDEDALAEEPSQWVMGDFRKWRSRGCRKSTAAYTASLADNSTNTTSQTSKVTVPVTVSQTKLEKDVYLNWRRGKQDSTMYPIFEND